MKTLNNVKKGNVSTSLTQLGENSFMITEVYLGNTVKEIGRRFYTSLTDATLSFDLAVKN